MKTVRQLAVVGVLALLLVSFWSDPAGSATTVTDAVGSVGRFFSTVIDKSVQFFRGLDD